MTKDTDVSHDHLFKQVLGEFFPEFIELFFPQVAAYLDRDSIEFLPLEVFADLLEGQALETDVIVKAKFQGQDSFFIIHVEHQANYYQGFDRRLFNYFTLLHRDYGLPVYPIVIFSHRSPQEDGDRTYEVTFADWQVLRFNYRVIRLNHLPWRDYINQENPVASAFMAKMKVPRRERPLAKLACLQSLARQRLNPAQMLLLSGFIDTYLRLEPQEETILQEELDKIGAREKESVMNIVTSWMEQGMEQGRAQGMAEEQEQSRAREAAMLVRLLRRKIGTVSATAEPAIGQLSLAQLEQLSDALFDFASEEDLLTWLNRFN
jgi:Domain of unknown function (DUF4351)